MYENFNPQPLLAFAATMSETPHRFAMGQWVYLSTRIEEKQADLCQDESILNEVRQPEKNLCGTFCCIGGGLVAHHDQVDLRKLPLSFSYEQRVYEILNIQPDRGQDHACLFFLEDWPEFLQEVYLRAPSDERRVEVLQEAIRFFARDPELFDNYDAWYRDRLPEYLRPV